MHRNLKIAGLLAGIILLGGCSLYEQIEPETEESTTQTPAATTTASQTEASAEETEQPTTAEPVTEEPSSEEPTAEETTAEEETTSESETTIHFGDDDMSCVRSRASRLFPRTARATGPITYLMQVRTMRCG